MNKFRIADVRVFVIEQRGAGGDYHSRDKGHWLTDTLISTPMSIYPEYRASRTSWGIDTMGGIVVEIEAEDGTVGVSTGFGGDVSGLIIERHFRRFLVGSDSRDVNRIWDQMYRASLFYGRKGIAISALSAVDLALWDLVGRLRGEPVYKMIGGATREKLAVYATGVKPKIYKDMGFIGAKMPLPYSPSEGSAGLRSNVDWFAKAREEVGRDFPLMIDCYMSLDVRYAIELALALKDFGVNWIEEALHPDDWDGFRHLRSAAPFVKWTTGEHEATRYGFRELLAHRVVDILQPDMMWAGGLTEILRIAAHAAAFDVEVVPHGSGPYGYHFVMSNRQSPFTEYVFTSPEADQIQPVFGGMFDGEPLPENGTISVSDAPGWGMELNKSMAKLRRVFA